MIWIVMSLLRQPAWLQVCATHPERLFRIYASESWTTLFGLSEVLSWSKSTTNTCPSSNAAASLWAAADTCLISATPCREYATRLCPLRERSRNNMMGNAAHIILRWGLVTHNLHTAFILLNISALRPKQYPSDRLSAMGLFIPGESVTTGRVYQQCRDCLSNHNLRFSRA